MNKQLSRAFTLVELLIVIAVLSLLITVIVPSLVRAKENAKSIVCKTLLKNNALALYAYFWETNELLPISINDPIMRPWYTFDEFRSSIGLHPLAQEYKDRQVGQLQEYKPAYAKKYICPSAKYALDHPEDGLFPIDRSYGLNAHAYYYKDYVRRRLASQSWNILCMGDALDWWFSYPECDKYQIYGEDWKGVETYGMAAFRHNEKANMAYWDGHVDKMDAEQLKKHLEKWLYMED